MSRILVFAFALSLVGSSTLAQNKKGKVDRTQDLKSALNVMWGSPKLEILEKSMDLPWDRYHVKKSFLRAGPELMIASILYCQFIIYAGVVRKLIFDGEFLDVAHAGTGSLFFIPSVVWGLSLLHKKWESRRPLYELEEHLAEIRDILEGAESGRYVLSNRWIRSARLQVEKAGYTQYIERLPHRNVETVRRVTKKYLPRTVRGGLTAMTVASGCSAGLGHLVQAIFH